MSACYAAHLPLPHPTRYVIKKGMLKTGALKWYDWQYYSIFPQLFHKFGSLRMISQETMEAQQAHMNQFTQRSNGWGNVGRRMKSWIAESVQAVKEGMARRAAQARSMERWLYERCTLSWFGQVHEVFERLEKRKEEGQFIPYIGDDYSHAYVPAHNSWKAVSPNALKIVAHSRLKGKNAATFTELRRQVLAHRTDLPEDLAHCAAWGAEDRHTYLLKRRKARWHNAKGQGSGRELLHRKAEVAEDERKALQRMFGPKGMFPIGCGRARTSML